MKHVLAILFSISILFIPMTAFAAIGQSDLDAYLASIGWTQEELEEELSYEGMTLEDFETIQELQDFIGKPLTEENLQELLDAYEITREDLNSLLVESGELEVGQDVLEVYSIYEYLEENLEFYLFEGTPITDESLQDLLDTFEMTYEELVALFEENGDSIDDYEFVEDVEVALIEYMYGDELPGFEDLFTELGITEAELEALMNHLMNLDLEDPIFEQKMDELSNRMIALGDFESAEDLTKEQIVEMADIMTEMFNLFQLDAKFYLSSNGKTEPVTLSQLLSMSEKEASGYDLLIELYDHNGVFILDMLLTADMVNSDLIEETAKDLNMAETTANKVIHKPVTKTEKGAKMPKTAGNYMESSLYGIGFILIGWMVIRRLRMKSVA
ncbi:processed acidic surface protein [Pseudalkalibacillus berkeleyi]|uniref:Processed acidic surface protein n=1 Tax=Pseudalkalibacillus berkeleyi TaxID=1069813 RepID=A0ABS9H1I9_9BACL|nr:processed acidic surface protein [Pseudalkalibacillus berkeleyi]MCF6137766.1 processed acidic surface protein [Pseudalkalibacillus berkeleyi]